MRVSQVKLIIFISALFTIFYNFSFFENVIKVYNLKDNFLFVGSLGVVLFLTLVTLFALISNRYIIKPLLIIITLISALVAYFSNNYGVVIDSEMIRNIVETNINESADLFNIKLILYLIFLFVAPSIFIYKVKIEKKPFFQEVKDRAKAVFISLILIVALFFSFSKHYTSFFREHKPLRYYTNPTYWIYSLGYYISHLYVAKEKFKIVDANATIDSNETKIVILVVGEAARADHFYLNGYSKNTTPRLSKDDIINLPNVYSCGTSTAYSVPCMFSVYTRSNYSRKKADNTQNVLDILKETKKVAILWRDNNSDSKKVALRVRYEDFKTPKKNKICDVECRDEGMLIGLKDFIDKNKGKNVLIILHQMGNHGPAYYKRYPKSFEKFKPVCKTNELNQCTKEQINNAYDNAIYYTDYFLDKVIKFLSQYNNKKTALIYMADHGESLGENGIYLHGLPYFIAPEAQKHIGALLWFNSKWDKNLIDKLRKNAKKEYSHNNLFHTLLGIFGVKSKVYNQNLDILKVK